MTSSGIESKSAILARTKTAVKPEKDVTGLLATLASNLRFSNLNKKAVIR